MEAPAVNQRIIGMVAGLLACTSVASAQSLPAPNLYVRPPVAAEPVAPAAGGFASTVTEAPGRASISDVPAAPAPPAAPAVPVIAPVVNSVQAPAKHLPPSAPVSAGPYHDGGLLDTPCDSCCTPSCTPCCEAAPARPRSWGKVDYLLWWTRNDHIGPALVTTDTSNPVQPLFTSGAILQPGTLALYGANNVNYGSISGARVTLGAWLDCQDRCGLEGSGFLLDRATQTFARSSFGTPVLAVPFFNASPAVQAESVAYAAYPGVFAGRIVVESDSRLWGAEANGVLGFENRPHVYWHGIYGFRYLNLREGLNLGVTAFGNGPTFNQEIDRFQANNEFYGGQVGMRVGMHIGHFNWELSGKAAIGDAHQTISISGTTTQIGIQPEGIFPGGIFAEPSNIGQRKRDDFAVVPEASVQIGWDILCNVHAFLGYTFLYDSSVIRPGDQIDRNVNATQQAGGGLTGNAVPVARLLQTDYWAHGLNFGVTWEW
jgi:hypothetical protein